MVKFLIKYKKIKFGTKQELQDQISTKLKIDNKKKFLGKLFP